MMNTTITREANEQQLSQALHDRTTTKSPTCNTKPQLQIGPQRYAPATAKLPTGRGPAIAPGTSGTRWMVSDPTNTDGGSIHIAIVKDKLAGSTPDRRHVHVLVPPVLCTDEMHYRREAYVAALLQRCTIFHRWQLESILPAKT